MVCGVKVEKIMQIVLKYFHICAIIKTNPILVHCVCDKTYHQHNYGLTPNKKRPPTPMVKSLFKYKNPLTYLRTSYRIEYHDLSLAFCTLMISQIGCIGQVI